MSTISPPAPDTAPRNGVTYVLKGSMVCVPAGRPVDRVRIARHAVALGATGVRVYVNGHSA